MNPYTTLNIPTHATDKEIKRAYRKLANKHHPDKGGDREDFERVQLAYLTLSDPEKRRIYDETGVMDGENGKQSAAEQLLISFFEMAVEHWVNGRHGTEPDIHGDIVNNIEGNIANQADVRRVANARIAKLNKVVGTIGRKDKGNNWMDSTIRASILVLESEITNSDKKTVVLCQSRELLKFFTFPEQPPPITMQLTYKFPIYSP